MFEVAERRGRLRMVLLERPVVAVMLGLSFVAVDSSLAIASSLSGHGSYLPWILVFSGYPVLGGLVWPAVGALVALRRKHWAALLGLGLLAGSLVGSIASLSQVGEGFSVLADLGKAGLTAVVALLLYAAVFCGSAVLLIGALVGLPRRPADEWNDAGRPAV